MNAPEIVAHRPPNVAEVHVIWMTTGLGCDGDSVPSSPPPTQQ